jgi:hypothetical protein
MSKTNLYFSDIRRSMKKKRPSYSEMRDSLDLSVNLIKLMRIDVISIPAIDERLAKIEKVLEESK